MVRFSGVRLWNEENLGLNFQKERDGHFLIVCKMPDSPMGCQMDERGRTSGEMEDVCRDEHNEAQLWENSLVSATEVWFLSVCSWSPTP
ncbi:hypothetical protein VNO80_26868 [Phaseolus coccineus]|uniref:Uncharacterized protein n=1 Tax=Phaseolus coccineus TaxID=3886 RepID=A0AAN9LFK9_PHACN